MCMLHGSYAKVCKTCIGVFRTPTTSNTVIDTVVYSNHLTFPTNAVFGNFRPVMTTTSMILAVPCQTRANLTFVDYQENTAEQILSILGRTMKPLENHSRFSPRTLGGGFGSNSSSVKPLEVELVGNYLLSFAASVDELSRLDPNVFEWDAGFISSLRNEYTDGQFGFIVSRLTTSGTYHPLIYSYVVNPANPIFVPTLHIHPKKQTTVTFHGPSSTPVTDVISYSVDAIADDFDHEIYFILLDVVSVKHLEIKMLRKGEIILPIMTPTRTNVYATNSFTSMQHIDEAATTLPSLLKSMLPTSKSFNIASAIRIVIRGAMTNGDIVLMNPQTVSPIFCDDCREIALQMPFYTCTRCKSYDTCMSCFTKKTTMPSLVPTFIPEGHNEVTHGYKIVNSQWTFMQRLNPVPVYVSSQEQEYVPAETVGNYFGSGSIRRSGTGILFG